MRSPLNLWLENVANQFTLPSVEVLGTLFLGPRLEVTLNLRDGTQEQQSIRPGDHVYFSQPWKAASSDERKLPIEFFSSINFGTTEIITQGSGWSSNRCP